MPFDPKLPNSVKPPRTVDSVLLFFQNHRSRTWICCLLLSLLVLTAYAVARPWRQLQFDDAYMFYRYASNLKHGLGISWNPDGVPTYGLTSQFWLICILPLTYFFASASTCLQFASWLTSVLAVTVLAYSIAASARSRLLKFPPITFAIIVLPLMISFSFRIQIFKGMDTMLSLLMNAVLVAAVLHRENNSSFRTNCWVGTAAFLAFFARPDNGIVALAVPFSAWLFLSASRRIVDLLAITVIPVVLIGLYLAACNWYFGTPVPLSFYVKSTNSYAGFISPESAMRYFIDFMTTASLFNLLIFGFVRRGELLVAATFIVPTVMTVLYLLTVRQVMGFDGRYYIPLLPFVIAPALLILDARIVSSDPEQLKLGTWRAITVMALFVIAPPVSTGLELGYRRFFPLSPISVPALPHAAFAKLPELEWFDVIAVFSDKAVAPLVGRTTVAASEVGFLGAAAPDAQIIDLVGLNDIKIGRFGFSMDDLLARKPDLIWFPSTDYTGLRATIFSDRRLFAQYVVFDQAFNYGVAVRKTSSVRSQIEANLRLAWASLYPGYDMDSYRVTDTTE